jgi:prepilin-type N-terminal cleavage/methylation domain-containing protein
VDTRLCGYDENRRNNGFTLVELSIVLVIIGLLTSGILLGKDLIRAAELRSITSEKDQIQTAVMVFKNKYLGLPGDLRNATDFWGTMPTGSCPNASDATGTQTCNGNGDGQIGHWGPGTNWEELVLWQHLSNAGLIQGKYTGVWSGTLGAAGQHYASKISNNYWALRFFVGDMPISNPNVFEGRYDHNMEIFGAGTYPLTTSEAWNIDSKIDDGLAGLGKVVTAEHNGENCNSVAASTTVALSSTASYNFDYSSPTCSLIFRNLW